MTRSPALVLALIAVGAASPVLARGPSGARPGRALFERAQASFEQGRFAEARADYQAAYDLEPLPALLFDIGQCYRNLGQYQQARAYFQRYTELEPGSPNREATERLAAEMARLDREDRLRARQPPVLVGASEPAPAPPLGPPAIPASALAASPPVTPTLQRAASKPAPPLYRRTWFWVGLGGALAAGVAVALASSRDNRSATLAPIDAR